MGQILNSVGIDIGTSTTQIVFSKIKIENTASLWTVPKVNIVNKEIVYRSQVYFTPLISSNTIDGTKLKKIIDQEYNLANIRKKDLDTGAVIITGETARKENAEEILNMLSDYAGDFVVATAGPDLESILAGKGSGAFEYSKEHSATVINLDIGGGTTNAVVFQNGKTIDTACFDIGGRLIKISEDGQITYISEKIKSLSKNLHLGLEEGNYIDQEKLKVIVNILAETINNIINSDNTSKEYQHLITNHDFKKKYDYEAVFLSGGVADCVANEYSNWNQYGDIGILLGKEIRTEIVKTGKKVIYGQETISATVVGAGNHTTDISGSTIYYDLGLLPIKNIPIIAISEEEEQLSSNDRIMVIEKKLNFMMKEGDTSLVALSINGNKGYGFKEIEELASDIIKSMKKIIDKNMPLIVLVEKDFGKSLGMCINNLIFPKNNLICIDSISVEHGDYIDIGVPVANGQVIPVVIKTILFGY